ncbi:MAG: hypothetical protein Q8O38_16935 [Sulfurimicrobium sp.]|nr:hypothetical protein [Sulfurimicrobium sp.]
MTELETLFPQPIEIIVAGKSLSILPIKVGKLPAFIRAVAPFFAVFKQGGEVDFIVLLADHGDSVLDACAIGSGTDRAFIDDLDPAQLVNIAQLVVEVNMDFFTRRLVPVITAAARVAARTGASSSPA